MMKIKHIAAALVLSVSLDLICSAPPPPPPPPPPPVGGKMPLIKAPTAEELEKSKPTEKPETKAKPSTGAGVSYQSELEAKLAAKSAVQQLPEKLDELSKATSLLALAIENNIVF